MKILIINDYVGRAGGAETFIHTLKSILEKRGHILEIFGSNDGEDTASLFSRWYSNKWYKKTLRKIKEFKPDVIHINNCARILSPSVIKAGIKSNIPTIVTIHDFHFICPKIWGIRPNGIPCKKWFGLRCLPGNCKGFEKSKAHYPIFLAKVLRTWLHRRTIKNSQIKIFAPSKILAKSMEKSLGINVGVINNGIEIPKKTTTYKKEIIFTSRVSEEKGLQTIAKTLNNVKDYKVNILGDGKLYHSLKSKYKNINFLGFKNPKGYYETASIGLIPSIWMENFSYSVIETMSYGICLIASRRGGIPEQIEHMKTGLLFEPGNEKDFKKQLDYLIKNPEEIKRMGKNARKKVIANWDWENIVIQYEKVYTNTMKN